jgi:hypothetical protein
VKFFIFKNTFFLWVYWIFKHFYNRKEKATFFVGICEKYQNNNKRIAVCCVICFGRMSTNDVSVGDSVDAFKDVFKFYKRRDRPLDLTDVVDVRHPEKWSHRLIQLKNQDTILFEEQFTGLQNASGWKIFKLQPDEHCSSSGDGIIIIQNPFTESGNNIVTFLSRFINIQTPFACGVPSSPRQVSITTLNISINVALCMMALYVMMTRDFEDYTFYLNLGLSRNI